MGYPANIERLLKSKNIEVGDFIKVEFKDRTYEGILMPRIEFGDPSCLVLKFKDGYNIGIKLKEGIRMSLVNKGKPFSLIKEERTEFKPFKPTVSILHQLTSQSVRRKAKI